MIGVEKRKQFLRKQKLQWFEYIERMDNKIALVKAKSFVVDGFKRGKDKKRGKVAVEKKTSWLEV